ncbi:Adhesion G-protein coupled receptor G4 [Araneus ventricosus]|uniref:Adhesion G-protein coupled receptor G4 n=1 Tax=Araneus ventricosus TaxID=182803 RepID=A0A4Y2IQ27_ARAVE|nr:Adhesion G-protein coupled receptor G4 [Araneus ventricosus]
MKSEIPGKIDCSYLVSLELPFIEDFNKYLDVLYGDGSKLFLKHVVCYGSVISTYHHFYILKDKGTEKELQNFFENGINSGNGSLSESLERLDINKDNITIKSTVSCSKDMSHYNGHHLSWPETPIGQSTLPDEICITAEGSALERKCLGDFYMGAHWGPVENGCTDVQSNFTMTLHKLAKMNITEDNIFDLTSSMEMLTTAAEDLSPSDVQYVAQILRNVARVPSIEPEVLRSVVHTVDTVINTISASENRYILSNLPRKISTAVENIALKAQTNNQAVKAAGNNIALSVLPLTLIPRGAVLENWGSNVTALFNDSDKDHDERLIQFESFEAGVLLPENVLAEKRGGNRAGMVIVVRRNSQFLKNLTVMSPVIDVVTGTEPVYNVDPPLEMVFKVTKMGCRERKSNWGCVSWDETLNNNFGGWSYKGCVSVLIDTTHVRCYCDHLTSFAVILEINPEFKIPKVHSGVLSIFTYMGCSLSIFGLGVIILTFAIFRKWREDIRHKILFNLSACLTSFLLIFLIGIQKKEWGYGCMAVAILLHYFMLASLLWMLVEAFLQYLFLVKVIGIYIPHFLQKVMLFAWGIPIIVVGIVLSVNHELYYSRTEFCCLSGDAFHFAVAFPVSTSLAINFIMFVIIFFSVTYGQSKEKLRCNQDQKKDMIARAKAMFCVSVLLGLSWIFGFLAAIDETKLVFQYFFVITTTLQGFLFFFFFVLRQKNTRELWRNLVKTSSTSVSSQPIGLK